MALSVTLYPWLAKTSQQPIRQTTWLKVTTPHSNHRNPPSQITCSENPKQPG
jgi:hypothetical protein